MLKNARSVVNVKCRGRILFPFLPSTNQTKGLKEKRQGKPLKLRGKRFKWDRYDARPVTSKVVSACAR